jgi:hypothetical protein
MAFKFAPKQSVTVTVRVTDVWNNHKARTFKAHFKYHPAEQAQQMAEKLADADAQVLVRTIHDNMIGWEQVEGEDGPLEFNAENLDGLLSHTHLRKGLFEAFIASLSGQEALGNSPR